MEPRDAGSAVLITAHFTKKAFNNTLKVWEDQDFDPSPVPTVTVLDPVGAATSPAVTNEDMTKSDAGVTGYWYFVLQTLVAWSAGLYRITATATDGTNTNVEIEFILELKKPYS